MRLVLFSLLPVLFTSTACSDGDSGNQGNDGQGTVTVTAYGESFIEDGIPASEMADGWAVEFERFEVNITEVNVAGADISVPASVDLSESSSGDGHELGSELVSTGDYGDGRFDITRVDVEGTAAKGSVTKTFHWEFEDATSYKECDTTTSVTSGGDATFQITVHADHLFYDSLVAEEPQVLFQAFADADADEDGVITQAELADTDIGAYDPGSEGGIDDLWVWLIAQSRTLGHVDGEGHCHAETTN